MIHITAQMRVLVAIEPVDGRKRIDSLVRICQAQLGEDPFSGCMFFFRNRSDALNKAVATVERAGIRCSSSTVAGVVVEEVIRIADKWKADRLVAGLCQSLARLESGAESGALLHWKPSCGREPRRRVEAAERGTAEPDPNARTINLTDYAIYDETAYINPTGTGPLPGTTANPFMQRL